MLEAANRAAQWQEEGNMAGAEMWHRILNAIERLQAMKPADDGRRTKLAGMWSSRGSASSNGAPAYRSQLLHPAVSFAGRGW
jgi:hypothetical protein